MAHLGRNASPIAVALASLLLWGSFAWGLPADTPPFEAEAGDGPKDPWAGVKISDAYDYAKCPRCGHKNEVRRPACYRCGYPLPQPSGEYTYPPWVFVPGLGYYREGTLIEPARTKKRLWVTGLVLSASAVGTFVIWGVGDAAYWWETMPGIVACPLSLALFGMVIVGAGLIIYGLVSRTEPVYAFVNGELLRPYDRPTYALRPADSDGVALEVELTVLGF